MDALFWASKSHFPFIAIIKLGRPRIFVYITAIEKRKLYTLRMT